MYSFNPEKITLFAKTDARGQEVPFGIKAKDRQRHMYVVGKTGMGKSTLLENMAVQDIQNGEGMAFIDPHGSAAETLLEYVPEHRVNDVIYFAPFDLNHPVSFNVMEDVGADKRHLVVSGLMSTFKKIWVDAWSARMEYILTNALLALIEYPDTTLLSVNRLFSDKHYRNRVVEYIKDPAVKSFWTEEFANYTDRFAAEALPAIQNKIGQFTGNPLIRNIIGQPHSSFDIRKIMDEKKILIMNLSKGLVGETNANLLGSMLTTRIYLAAMSRADLPVATMKTMPNFYFYVDEFQSFANATFANILSEARKYHLNLIIAHQYIAQMEDEVRDAVFGNVGTTITFRVGPFDAEILEPVFTPRFLATDLVNLGFAQIYLTLMIDGVGSLPFSATTLPPIQKPHISCRDMVIAASRRNFTKPREEVEKIIADLHTPIIPPPKPKDTKQSLQNGNKSKSSNQYQGNDTSAATHPNHSKNNHKSNAVPVSKSKQAPSPVSNSAQKNPTSSQTEFVSHTKSTSAHSPTDTSSKKNNYAPATPHINELRGILASMVQKNNHSSAEEESPKNDTNSKSSPHAASRLSVKSTSPASESSSKSTPKNQPTPTKSSQPSKSKETLKSLLAMVADTKNTPLNPKNSTVITRKDVPSVSSTVPASPVDITAPSSSPSIPETTSAPVSSSIKDEMHRMAAEADALFAQLSQPSNSQSSPRPSVSSPSPSSSTPPPPPPPMSATSGPDPKVVAKLLKGPKERSPFK
jgi:hypothetical protein